MCVCVCACVCVCVCRPGEEGLGLGGVAAAGWVRRPAEDAVWAPRQARGGRRRGAARRISPGVRPPGGRAAGCPACASSPGARPAPPHPALAGGPREGWQAVCDVWRRHAGRLQAHQRAGPGLLHRRLRVAGGRGGGALRRRGWAEERGWGASAVLGGRQAGPATPCSSACCAPLRPACSCRSLPPAAPCRLPPAAACRRRTRSTRCCPSAAPAAP